jgi:uncharacterized membrane protein YdjX (TVP38/TMEM64 family)
LASWFCDKIRHFARIRTDIIKLSIFHKILAGLGLVLIMVVMGGMVDYASWLNLERLQALLHRAGWLAPLVYMGMMALAVVIAIIPSLPLDVAAGAFFGPLLGTLYSALGATVGAAVAFLIARYLGREAVKRFVEGHISFCRECSNRLLTRVVFISRLIPFISFDVVSYGAGLTQMSFWSFTLASFFGMLPLTFLYNQFGTGLMVNQPLAVFLGIVMIVLLFIGPGLVERYHLLSGGPHVQHSKDQAPADDKNSEENCPSAQGPRRQ